LSGRDREIFSRKPDPAGKRAPNVGRGPARRAAFCNTFVFATQHGWANLCTTEKGFAINPLRELTASDKRRLFRDSRIRVYRPMMFCAPEMFNVGGNGWRFRQFNACI
jgi:hypothetical protein